MAIAIEWMVAIITARKRSCGKVMFLQVSGPGGAWSGGVPGGEPPGRPLMRAVRILLECILVYFRNRFSTYFGVL